MKAVVLEYRKFRCQNEIYFYIYQAPITLVHNFFKTNQICRSDSRLIVLFLSKEQLKQIRFVYKFSVKGVSHYVPALFKEEGFKEDITDQSIRKLFFKTLPNRDT